MTSSCVVWRSTENLLQSVTVKLVALCIMQMQRNEPAESALLIRHIRKTAFPKTQCNENGNKELRAIFASRERVTSKSADYQYGKIY